MLEQLEKESVEDVNLKLCDMLHRLINVCNDNLLIIEDKYGQSIYIDNFREDILKVLK